MSLYQITVLCAVCEGPTPSNYFLLFSHCIVMYLKAGQNQNCFAWQNCKKMKYPFLHDKKSCVWSAIACIQYNCSRFENEATLIFCALLYPRSPGFSSGCFEANEFAGVAVFPTLVSHYKSLFIKFNQKPLIYNTIFFAGAIYDFGTEMEIL